MIPPIKSLLACNFCITVTCVEMTFVTSVSCSSPPFPRLPQSDISCCPCNWIPASFSFLLSFFYPLWPHILLNGLGASIFPILSTSVNRGSQHYSEIVFTPPPERENASRDRKIVCKSYLGQIRGFLENQFGHGWVYISFPFKAKAWFCLYPVLNLASALIIHQTC